MTTITVTLPDSTTTAHGFGREPAEVTRVRSGTPRSVRIPLWLRAGERAPRIGERTATYRDGATIYALGVAR